MGKLTQAYDACMDTDQAQSVGLKPLKEFVEHIKDLVTPSGPRGGPRRLHTPVLGGVSPIKGLNDALAFLTSIDTEALVKLDIVVSASCPAGVPY